MVLGSSVCRPGTVIINVFFSARAGKGGIFIYLPISKHCVDRSYRIAKCDDMM